VCLRYFRNITVHIQITQFVNSVLKAESNELIEVMSDFRMNTDPCGTP